MQLSNAVKTLERKGFTVTNEGQKPSLMNPGEMVGPFEYIARKPGNPKRIEILRNGRGDDVATIRVVRDGDKDDSQSDYCAGSFFPTLKRAIEHAERE